MARNFTLLIVLSYMVHTFSLYTVYRPWQVETRAMAQAIKAAEGPVLVYGDVTSLSTAKAVGLLSERALAFRMEQLTGQRIMLCQTAPDQCAKAEESGAPAFRVEVATTGAQVHLSYPK